jgi:aquaporin Z
MDTRKLLAEAIGTFTLVGIGSMAIVSTLATSGPVLAIVPFGFGLGLLAAIAFTGHISGGHYNPAVTLAAVVDKRMDVTSAVGYVVAQVVGAIAASAVILVLTDTTTVAATRNAPGVGFSEISAFIAEVVLTAVFLAVILTVTRRDPGHAWLTIPLTLLVIHVAGIPISGASVNPARALGPALVSGDLGAIWIYLTAPFVGALVGWGIYKLLGNDAGD